MHYLDTSIALHAVLPGGDPRARAWIDEAFRSGQLYSSSLLRLEVTRVLRRERLEFSLADPLLDRVNLVSIDDGILAVGCAIESHVRSLDALHLATCLVLGFEVTVITHDSQMVRAAAGLGLRAYDPLAG